VKREFAGEPGKYEEFLAVKHEYPRSVMTIAFILQSIASLHA
jgi:hypothetical protein